jgi:hypothetical protein
MIPVSNKTRSITRVGYKHPAFWRQENTITILTVSPGGHPGMALRVKNNDFTTRRSESATKNSADLACAARNYYFYSRQLAFAHVALCRS